MVDGKQKVRAAAVEGKQVICTSNLPEGTAAQKAEIVALIQALRMAEGKSINIYTDSQYAFATAHIHGAIYRKTAMLTSAGKDIKNKEEILSLLKTIHLSKKVAIKHCPGHQKTRYAVAKGNQMAYLTAKQVAQGAMILAVKEPKDYYDVREASFRYTPEDYQLIDKLGLVKETPYSVVETEEGKLVLQWEEGRKYITNLHYLTHLGAKKLKGVVRSSDYYVIGLSDWAAEIVQSCKACAMTNAGHSMYTPGKRFRDDRPGAY
jgi:ribonuclease HI